MTTAKSTSDDSRFPFPAVANGWFRLAYSDELAAGQVLPLSLLDRELTRKRGHDRVGPGCGRLAGFALLGEGARQCVRIEGLERDTVGSAKTYDWKKVIIGLNDGQSIQVDVSVLSTEQRQSVYEGSRHHAGLVETGRLRRPSER